MELAQNIYRNWWDGASGSSVPFSHVMMQFLAGDFTLLGETHTRLDHHLWQRDMIAEITRQNPKTAVGFEMFPASTQSVLNQWWQGDLSASAFLELVKWDKIWGFAPDLYMPLFDICRDLSLPMIALNCARPLVSSVGKLGWEGVPEDELEGLTPAKPATAKYRQYLFDVTGGARPDRQAKSPDDPAFDRFVRAQQTWDRAFACRMADYKSGHPDTHVIGIIGSGHLDFGGGTPYQLTDLGHEKHTILLPTDDLEPIPGIGDFVCQMTDPDQSATGT